MLLLTHSSEPHAPSSPGILRRFWNYIRRVLLGKKQLSIWLQTLIAIVLAMLVGAVFDHHRR